MYDLSVCVIWRHVPIASIQMSSMQEKVPLGLYCKYQIQNYGILIF